MKKIEPENYRGIQYIRLSNLPEEQQGLIHQWLSEDRLIKIVYKGILLDDCLQYSDYQNWFDHVMPKQSVAFRNRKNEKKVQAKDRSKNQKDDLLLRIWPFSSLSLKS